MSTSERRRLTALVGIRMTDDLYARLSEAARRQKESPASYARFVICHNLGGIPDDHISRSTPVGAGRRKVTNIQKDVARFLGALGVVANNLNQAQTVANQRVVRKVIDTKDIQCLTDEIRRAGDLLERVIDEVAP